LNPQFSAVGFSSFVRDRIPKQAITEAVKLAKIRELVTKKKAVEIVTKHGITPSANKPGQDAKPDAWKSHA